MDVGKLVAVGKIISSHGIKGSVKILPYGETLLTRPKGSKLFVGLSGTEPYQDLTVIEIKPQKSYLIVSFQGISERTEAERIRGKEVYLPESELPLPEDAEFFYYQLIGLKVSTISGKFLGVLEGILETPGHDIYLIRQDSKEILIPAVSEIVREVNLKAGLMLVDPPEGLVDDDF